MIVFACSSILTVAVSVYVIAYIVYIVAYVYHLRDRIKVLTTANEILRNEKSIMKSFIGLDKCGDCITCQNGDGDICCPFYGEPNGCNNRECAEAYNMLYGDEREKGNDKNY